MERDFMGLNFKNDTIVIKEEDEVEFSKDTELSKGSGVPWPSSSKVSALPHFMSFKAAQEEKARKILSDHHLGSSGFLGMSSSNAYDLNNKRQSSEFQPVHPSHPYNSGNQFFKTHFGGAGQNFGGATMKQQPFIGGIPVTTPQSMLPSSSFVAGTTDPRFNAKTAGAPVQLTIFYGGTVNVYDDISPEKAQAIMFMAGNSISNTAPPKHQVQPPASKYAAGNGTFMNRTVNTPPGSGLSSCLSVSSHSTGDHDETKGSKAKGISNTHVSNVETPNINTPLGPFTPSSTVPSAVPQARKASLARFLEKRKERVITSSPYNHSTKFPENPNPESSYADFSATSGAGFRSMFAGNKTGLNL